MIAESPGRRSAGFDRTFDSEEDPHGFVLSVRARHSRICEMLDSVRGARKFTQALEVGCAAGLFLLLLAQPCDSMLAPAVSPVALRRPRERCSGLSHVEFALCTVARDPMT